MKNLTLLVVFVLSSSLVAQTTWIVNAAGGPGVHFTDLPSAVAAANDGDTILVQTGPFFEGAAPFTTDKGLTIVGDGGQVPIATSLGAPITISGLPAGRAFRMVGFERPFDGELNFVISNCAGQVHLERIHAREPGLVGPNWPAIVITNSPSVTLRDIVNFGQPAVQVDNSTVVLVSCRLGVTPINVGGGTGVVGSSSSLTIVQPHFDAGPTSVAISATNCTTRIAGGGGSLIVGAATAAGTSTPIVANGGTVQLDLSVLVVTLPAGGLGITGTATVTLDAVPASWTDGETLVGQTLSLVTTAGVGSLVFVALGESGPLIQTSLGLLAIDPLRPYGFFQPAIVTTPGQLAMNQIAVPATLPIGLAFAAQAVVFDGLGLTIGSPVPFVLH